jgi:hypothetical protein
MIGEGGLNFSIFGKKLHFFIGTLHAAEQDRAIVSSLLKSQAGSNASFSAWTALGKTKLEIYLRTKT